MDLLERGANALTRHPWETARLEAVVSLLEPLELAGTKVLDVGCGDAYLIDQLQQRLQCAEAVAQDVHLTDELIHDLSRPHVELIRDLDQLGERRFDVVLLLDVLEHIDDPEDMLRALIRKRMTSSTNVLVTVPAFQRLFTQHDRDLKHVRRYSLSELENLLRGSGLTVGQSGYLFSSLLMPRAATALKEALVSPKARTHIGLDGFNAPRWVGRALHRILAFDNRVCLWSRKHGVTLPGLSAWALCTTT